MVLDIKELEDQIRADSSLIMNIDVLSVLSNEDVYNTMRHAFNRREDFMGRKREMLRDLAPLRHELGSIIDEDETKVVYYYGNVIKIWWCYEDDQEELTYWITKCDEVFHEGTN